MNKIILATLASAATLLLCASALSGELAEQLSAIDCRLPGTEGCKRAIDAIEAKLKADGLEVKRMTFNALVPKTKSCELKVDGRKMDGVLPLGPNGFATNTAGGAPIEGPLVWLGDASINDMAGKKVDGAIVAMNFRSPNLKLAFSQGAKAAILVGDGEETQWDASKHFTEAPATFPRAFIDGRSADGVWLKQLAASTPRASLSLQTVWETAQAVNLWTKIPGEEGKTFHLDREEAVVFGAVYDSFGVTPDFCPNPRFAANCELLADIAGTLAKAGFKPQRSLYFVFFGAHYSAQDGARNFYFAVDKATEGGRNDDALTVRSVSYREELDTIELQLKILEQPDLFNISDTKLSPYAFKVQERLSKRLDAWVNNLNFEIQRTSLEAGAKPDEEQAAKLAKLKSEKSIWNTLRREMISRKITQRESMAVLAEDLRANLEAQREQARLMSENNGSFLDLGNELKGKMIVGHFDLNFSDASNPWTFNMAGDARMTRSEGDDAVSVAHFAKSLSVIAELYKKAMEGQPEAKAPLLLDSMSGLYNANALAVPFERAMPCNAAPGAGVYGYQLQTVADSLDRDELPYSWRPPDLLPLSPMLQTLAKSFADADSMSIRGPIIKARTYQPLTYFRSSGDFIGTRYMSFSNGSVSELEGAPDNAIVAFLGGNNKFKRSPIPGYTRMPMAMINKAGYVFIPNASHTNNPNNAIGAFGFDQSGALDRFPVTDRRDRLFYGFGGALMTPYNPTNYGMPSSSPKILNAKNNSSFRNFKAYAAPGVSCAYFDKPYDFKYLSDGLSLLGAEESRPLGYGCSFDRLEILSTNAVAQSAHDLCVLNQSRLDILRRKNIVNDSIETIHADAVEHLEAAIEARKMLDTPRASAHESFAAALSTRASKPLRDISNDMVQAVVVLLIISIPFAFFLERLVFGFTSIYRQVSGFAGFFVATFALLYMIHPAFSLASAPVVIFLAFVIVIMSALVIYIVMSKFKIELRAMQGLSSTVHGAAAESSAALAAVLIGISGMRNRPLKTFLTATTVILLTFTILVFASFSSKIGVVETYIGKAQGPDRVEIHRFTFLRIPEQVVDSIRGLYSKDWDVFTRSAVFSDPLAFDSVPETLLYNPATGKAIKIDAVLGLDNGELKRNSDLAQAAVLPLSLPANGPPPMLLPPSVAETMSLKAGDPIFLRGRKFSYAGSFNPLALEETLALDGAKTTPPDYAANAQEGDVDPSKMASKESEDGQQIDTSSFTYFSAQQTALCPESALRDLSPTLNFVSLYPKSGADMRQTAKELAEVFQGPVYSKSSDGVRQYFFTKEVKASGFAEVVVPLLLGGLIIFSSLLGSIIERSKEIFTYSALGLAPPDVGTLFFAESSVYAVLGGMGGYLFSQLVAFALSLLASQGLFHPPEMNFSSLSSVLTILIVMATVMLSTIYPALKAGKSANPGVARKWRMPKPQGDKISFVFPFTVSADDMSGILAFIGEHFENHTDASLGNFAANKVEVYEQPGGKAGIAATVSLAPFDLGVFQGFDMHSKPSEIEGIDEIVVNLERLNGTQGAWLRGNRAFIDELRNQFLLWRSLPMETVAHYKAQRAGEKSL